MSPARSSLPLLPLALLGVLGLAGCSNDCIDMCQEYEHYLKQCGYGWSTAFHEQGWASIDDCYEDNWAPSDNETRTCAENIEDVSRRSCY